MGRRCKLVLGEGFCQWLREVDAREALRSVELRGGGH